MRNRLFQAAPAAALLFWGLPSVSQAESQAAGPPPVQQGQTAPPELPSPALPPIWTLDGGITRISDANLNRFFSDFPVDARHYLPDAAWRYSAGFKFQPRFPESVPLRFNYNFVKQNYENLNSFDFTANDLSMEATLPKVVGLFPRIGSGFDWSTDNQNLTGNARWATIGVDHFGEWLTAVRFDATAEWTSFAESDRNAAQLGGRALFVKAFAQRSSVYAQLTFTRNDAKNEEFSYYESVPEGGVIWRQKDWLEWALRYQAHFRNYFAFDPRFLAKRDDLLNDWYLNARLIFVENLLSGFVSMQWERNLSNVDIKRYDDQIFSVGVQVSY